MNRRAGVAACCWMVWSVVHAGTAAGAAGDAPPSAPPPGVSLDETDAWSRWSVRLPGALISYAVPQRADGSREIFALIRPRPPRPTTEGDGAPTLPCESGLADEQRATELYRILLDAEPRLERIAAELPACEALDGLDTDEDGIDELLLGCPGRLYEIGHRANPESWPRRVLLEHADFHWRSFHPRSARGEELDGPARIASVEAGYLDVWTPSEEGPWGRLGRRALPVDATVQRDQLLVRTHLPRPLGRDAEGALLFAARAESLGNLRLRSELIRLSDDGSSSVTVSWSRLPEPEELLEQRFLLVAGEPTLWVTTKRADKLSLFGEKRVRLYPLRRDRSRLGLDPLFATVSRMNLWQPGEPALYDVNDDGSDDLVLGFWKGLMGSTVVLDVYLGDGAGSFAPSPRSTELEIKKGDRSFVLHGRDLDGDARPDLLVRRNDGLLLFSGRAAAKGRKLVENRPLQLPLPESEPATVTVQIGSDEPEGPTAFTDFGSNRPRLIDLDGDGLPEILLARRIASGSAGAGELTVIRRKPALR